MEIATLQQKLEANQVKIEGTIDQLKAIEGKMNLVENRDEYWNLLQTEKRIDKLEGLQKRWSGLMKHRDSLGLQRTKLLSRLTQVEGREAKRAGNLPSAKGNRRKGKAEREGPKTLGPILERKEGEASRGLARPAEGELSMGIPEATPSGAKGDFEVDGMEEEHDTGMKGKGKVAMTNTIAGPNYHTSDDDDDDSEEGEDEDDEEEDSDSSTEFILSSQPTSGQPIWE